MMGLNFFCDLSTWKKSYNFLKNMIIVTIIKKNTCQKLNSLITYVSVSQMKNVSSNAPSLYIYIYKKKNFTSLLMISKKNAIVCNQSSTRVKTDSLLYIYIQFSASKQKKNGSNKQDVALQLIQESDMDNEYCLFIYKKQLSLMKSKIWSTFFFHFILYILSINLFYSYI